jgi:catechol 2,3-dioxygenase-like lactoylglutathione lyase family enzyme
VSVSDYDRALAWYRDILGFELSYELKQYGWCELKTPFGFNIGLGQAETVVYGNVTPTFGVHEIDASLANLREHGVKADDWHEIPGLVRLAGYWVSRQPVQPAELVELGDLLDRHAAAEIELRIVPRLPPLWERVVASTLELSGIRLRNLGTR